MASPAIDATALKKKAAEAALDLLPENEVIGIGTGSTVNCLIELLPKKNIRQVISSSNASTKKLEAMGIEVLDPNTTGPIGFYVDGADEIDGQMRMIKGGGGALTREKVLASMSETFICLADSSKLVKQLGQFPLAIEVLPIARSAVSRRLYEMNGAPVYRTGFITDNGNQIVDCYELNFDDLKQLDGVLSLIPGLVEHGLFLQQRASVACIASPNGISVYKQIIPELLTA